MYTNRAEDMARKIKVAVVINDFLVGGAQRLTADLLSRLDRSQFEISLVTLMQFQDQETMYDFVPDDIKVYKFTFRNFLDIDQWLALFTLMRGNKPDIVLSNLFFSNTVTRVLAMLCSYRVVTVEHNTYVGNNLLQRFGDWLLSFLSYKIVAVSAPVCDYLVSRQGITRSKIVIIANGVDTARIARLAENVDVEEVRKELRIPADTKIVLSVGRLVTQKNHTLMIEAFSCFSSSHKNYVLVLLGDGNLRRELTSQIHSLGAGTFVRLVGNRNDVYRYYAVADFFLSTSYIEGLSIAHLEALACGVPLLATRTAGAEVLIREKESGLFIKDTNVDAVYQGLIQMISLDLTHMQQQARKISLEYDISRTVGAYAELLKATFASGGRR